MDGRTIRLIVGVLLLGVATLGLLGSVLPAVDLPVITYALIVIGLFGGVFFIGLSRPGQMI